MKLPKIGQEAKQQALEFKFGYMEKSLDKIGADAEFQLKLLHADLR